uniref:Ig-like domain-containing protein n=1 Tax=Romanomermis culicivorax TaxID=13658 RepID=A0A915I888_ROMCU
MIFHPLLSLIRPQGIYGAPLAPGTHGPQFTVPLRDIRGQEGNPLELECKVSGTPMPEITWFKDGEPLAPSGRMKMDLSPDGTAKLLIDGCKPSDEGLYRCVARNPYGTNHVKSNVTVKGLIPYMPAFGVPPFGEPGKAPRVVIPLDNGRSREGHPITLSCRIVGSPQPLIKWFKDGERLYPFGRYAMDQSSDGIVTLTIDQLTTRDTGCYRCIGENDFGSDRTTAELVVE